MGRGRFRKSNTSRKDRITMRRFKSACYILHENHMEIPERHAIFMKCVNEVRKGINMTGDINKDNKVMKGKHLKAQKLFIEKAINRYPEWFEGKKL